MYAISNKIAAHKASIETEEATKNAFVMPFIASVLGYDVFDPAEVIPEFTADVGLKRGEKIDYAIAKDGVVQILIECKRIGDPLNPKHASQLFRYFGVVDSARIAILTNGQEYHVFTDSDAPNRMDEKPFLVLDLLDVDKTLIPEMQKLSKESFDVVSVIDAAEGLKYVGQIRRILSAQVKEPNDDWVRFFTTRVYEGKATQKIVDQFRVLVSKAVSQYINDQVNDRLKAALGEDARPFAAANIESPVVAQVPADNGASASTNLDEIVVDSDIVTTDEELEAFNIVRAIVCSEVAPDRVVYRDSKSYCAILLDDNNRKPIARLHFNSKSTKFVMTFAEGKDGVRRDIEAPHHLYAHADELRQAVRNYA
ncbi:type I restriction endonuclease [Rhodococcus tukisamuensis]|uniref:type I restriction endonuclease n=1 Tax=Rhodococcus tukisamuensis TaxID=168276 RepID=UPI0020FFFBAC|nr:type I restriction endonuclease [Rhodococcus tukisamuensis]